MQSVLKGGVSGADCKIDSRIALNWIVPSAYMFGCIEKICLYMNLSGPRMSYSSRVEEKMKMLSLKLIII